MSGLRPLLEAPVGHGPVSAFFAAGCCMRDKQVVPSPPFLSVLSVSLTASRPPPIPFDVLDRGVSHGTFVLASSNPTTLRLAAWRGRRGARRTLFIQDSPQSKARLSSSKIPHTKVRQEVAVSSGELPEQGRKSDGEKAARLVGGRCKAATTCSTSRPG
jgi:hypothetical protein